MKLFSIILTAKYLKSGLVERIASTVGTATLFNTILTYIASQSQVLRVGNSEKRIGLQDFPRMADNPCSKRCPKKIDMGSDLSCGLMPL